MTDQQIPDPFRAMASESISLHEMFRSLQEAGFSEAQAIYLIGQVLSTALAQGSQQSND
jgi:hypothetical protein